MHTAMSILNEALPIRCVEGVFVSLYAETACVTMILSLCFLFASGTPRNMTTLLRVPLSFESMRR